MKFYITWSLLIFSTFFYAQKKDIWSGEYLLKSSEMEILDTIKIEKTADANPKDLVPREQLDLNRWQLSSISDNYADKIKLKNFLDDPKDKDEYEEFGWTELHLQDLMHCVDAGHLFICQTKPKSTVKFSKEEEFYSETGLFGIRLHFGLFNLERVTTK